MWINDFNNLHNKQCNHTNGWMLACSTLDGKERTSESVRHVDASHVQLGSSVANGGVDHCLGEDIRRWPTAALSNTTMCSASIRGQLECALRVHAFRFCRIAPDRKRIVFYRPLNARDRILRWRIDVSLNHAMVVLCRFDASGTPKQTGQAKPILVPLVHPVHATTSQWSQTELLGPEADMEHVMLGAHTAHWASWMNTCTVLIASKKAPLDKLVPIESTQHLNVWTSHLSGGEFVRWKPDRCVASADSIRQRLIQMTTCEKFARLLEPLPAKEVRKIPGAGIVYRVSASPNVDLTVRCGPLTKKGGGFVFTTDGGLKTGFPHVHTDATTMCLDTTSERLGQHVNLASWVCFISGEGDNLDARTTIVTMLRFFQQLPHPRPFMLVSAAHAPIWRAQLVGVFKFGTIADKHDRLSLLVESDRICLTPDERSIRVKGRE